MRIKTKMHAFNRKLSFKTLLISVTWLLSFCIFQSSAPAQCPLSCRALVNLSLGSNGTFTVNIYTVMNNPQAPCIPSYQISLADKDGKSVANPITCDYIGQTLTYTVKDITNNNYCWGNLFVEDKFKPSLTCADVTINCNDDDDPKSIGLVSAIDNCDPSPVILSQGEVQTTMNCNTTNGIFYTITRTWIAMDKSGNFSDPCVQKISVRKPNLGQVQFPKDYTTANNNALDCANTNTSPDSLGFPLLNGKPLELSCKILYTFKDSIEKRCSGSQTILRNWLVIDCCNNTTTSHLQTIEKVDKTPPKVVCPSDFTINTIPGKCFANVTLPKPVVTDNCSVSISITISGSGFGDLGFGPYLNVPPGLYEATYLICDGCSNCVFCQVAFEVVDKESPTVICNSDINVSVDANGIACVTLDDIENGTTDNCCLDSLDIKIMGQPDSLFGPKVTFGCNDVNKSFLVILRAFDCHGNVNFCMASVKVFDTSPPNIICPSDLTINCTESSVADSTGFAIATDICGIDTIFFSDSTILTPCKTGSIFRKWFAIDNSGNLATCIQKISIVDLTPSQITFPGDISISCSLKPDSTLTGSPTAVDDCSIFQINHSDLFFSPSNACDFINRTWTVKDICKNLTFSSIQKITLSDTNAPNWVTPQGSLDITVECDKDATVPVPVAVDDCTISNITVNTFISNMGCKNKYTKTVTYRAFDGCENASPPFVVKIVVNDNKKPTLLNCPKDTIVNSPLDSCNKFIVFPPVTATDNCGEISITNDSPFSLQKGANITGVYPVGTTKVKILAVDACNNRDSCFVNITVKDVAPPIADCADITICLLGSIQKKDSLFILTPKIIQNNWNFFDLCSPVTATVNPDTFTCKTVGPPPKQFVLTIKDASGNTTFCNGKVLVVDSFNVCGTMFANGNFISGQVTSRNMTPLKDLKVNVDLDGTNNFANTDYEGFYMYAHVPNGKNVSIWPSKSDDYLDGVDIMDAILLTRHLLGKQKFSDPYSYLAADVNESSSLSVADLGEIKRLIVHSQYAFSSDKSWKFLDSKCFKDILDKPLSAGLPQTINIKDISYHSLLNDFIAIKLGDVNMSSAAYGFANKEIETRSLDVALLELPDILLEKGKTYTLGLNLKERETIAGMQAALKFDKSVQADKVSLSNQANNSDGIFFDDAKNTLYFTYLIAEPQTLQHDSNPIVTFNLTCDHDARLRELVELDYKGFSNLGIDTIDQALAVKLIYLPGQDMNAENSIIIYENRPNPFKNETIWPVYNHGETQEAKLLVTSADGVKILQKNITLKKAYQEISLSRNELPGPGCYMVNIVADKLLSSVKVIVSE